MSDFRIAKRYAKAAFDAAKQQNLIEAWSNDFDLFYNSIYTSKQLKLLLKNPVVNKVNKIAIIQQLFGAKTNDASLKYFIFLIEKGRDYLILDIITAFKQARDEYNGIIHVEVTSFYPLSTEQTDLMKKKFSELAGKKVELSEKCDKSLLGGLVIQSGDTVYNGSIKRKFEMLKDHLCKRF